MESSLPDLPPVIWAAIGLIALALVLKLLGLAAKVIGLIVIAIVVVGGALYYTGNWPGMSS